MIKQVQTKLNDAGHNVGPVDGIVGPKTQKGLKEFQTSKGLNASGQIDRETLASYLAVGELSLDGRIAPSPGVLLAALHASANGLGLICPAAQGPEAAWAGDVLTIRWRTSAS